MNKVVRYRAGQSWEGCAYIGRPMRQVPRDVSGGDGFWGNPVQIGKDSVLARAEVIVKYAEWVTSDDERAVVVRARARELEGKTLVCWCAPKHCHGEVLAVLAGGGDTAAALAVARAMVAAAEALEPPSLFDALE